MNEGNYEGPVDYDWVSDKLYCEQDIAKIKYLSCDGTHILEADYCMKCKSTNVQVSKKGYKYCGEICWKKQD